MSSSTNNTNTRNTTPVIDINHPYFLSASDQPGLSLVSEALSDQNYQQWSRSVRIALSAKLKLGFIDGTQVKPDANSPMIHLWIRSNEMVTSWILNSVSAEIRKSLVYFDTAKQIWDDLYNRYAQGNVPRLFHLRKELASLTQGTNSINAYFTPFRGLSDELESMSSIPRCACAVSNAAIDKYEELIKLSQFLMGLNDQYTTTRGQILLINPLPDITRAYAMLLQEESQRASHTNVNTVYENAAMNVRFSAKNKSNQKKDEKKAVDTSLICDYCKLTGHVRDKCFALHGYPDWHRLYGQPKPKPKAQNKKVQIPANAVTTSGDNNSGGDNGAVLSDAQYQQLLGMFQNSLKSQPPNASWLTNTTASQSAGAFRTNSVIFCQFS